MKEKIEVLEKAISLLLLLKATELKEVLYKGPVRDVAHELRLAEDMLSELAQGQ